MRCFRALYALPCPLRRYSRALALPFTTPPLRHFAISLPRYLRLLMLICLPLLYFSPYAFGRLMSLFRRYAILPLSASIFASIDASSHRLLFAIDWYYAC